MVLGDFTPTTALITSSVSWGDELICLPTPRDCKSKCKIISWANRGLQFLFKFNFNFTKYRISHSLLVLLSHALTFSLRWQWDHEVLIALLAWALLRHDERRHGCTNGRMVQNYLPASQDLTTESHLVLSQHQASRRIKFATMNIHFCLLRVGLATKMWKVPPLPPLSRSRGRTYH